MGSLWEDFVLFPGIWRKAVAGVQGIFYSIKSWHILTVSKKSVVGQVPQGTDSETKIARKSFEGSGWGRWEWLLGLDQDIGCLWCTHSRRPNHWVGAVPKEGAWPWSGSTDIQVRILEDNQPWVSAATLPPAEAMSTWALNGIQGSMAAFTPQTQRLWTSAWHKCQFT